MHIVLINSSDVGGPGRAVTRIHNELLSQGSSSTMVVREQRTDTKNIVALEQRLPSETLGRFWQVLRRRIDSIPNLIYQDRSNTTFHSNILPNKGLRKVIKNQDPDIIQLNWVSGGMIRVEELKEINKPIVWKPDDMWPITGGCHFAGECNGYTQNCGSCPVLKSDSNLDLSRWNWKRKKRVYDHLDLTFVASSRWMEECIKSSSLTQNCEVVQIPLGLNLGDFKPIDQTEARRIFNLPVSKSLILFGAISPESTRKGFDLLIKSLKQLSREAPKEEIELVVFGDYLETTDLPLPTNQVGYLSDDESLTALYSAADVMVVPSREEPFGQTVIESLACGTPVVAFNATGPKDLVEHKTSGYLADPFDFSDLSNGILWVLNNAQKNKLEKEARQRAEENFDITSVIKEYSDLYTKLA